MPPIIKKDYKTALKTEIGLTVHELSDLLIDVKQHEKLNSDLQFMSYVIY